jgi:hypothetical protein
MSEKDIWLAPPEIKTYDSLEKEWFYNDLLYNLCIQLSYLNSSNEESYGAVALQKINGKPTIIGLGWNMYMGGETNLKRQGYANHAEFQSAALAEAIGYNLNDKNKETCIYVAGHFVKEDLLFFSPEPISFTCTNCTSNLPKYFKNTSLAAPTIENGWKHIPMLEAYYSSLYFNQQDFNRRDVIQIQAKTSRLNIGFNQEHMNILTHSIENFGITIDNKLKKNLLEKYEELLNLKAMERRKIVESLMDDNYKTYREKYQSSLCTH